MCLLDGMIVNDCSTHLAYITPHRVMSPSLAASGTFILYADETRSINLRNPRALLTASPRFVARTFWLSHAETPDHSAAFGVPSGGAPKRSAHVLKSSPEAGLFQHE